MTYYKPRTKENLLPPSSAVCEDLRSPRKLLDVM
jgi:hypothetical protein